MPFRYVKGDDGQPIMPKVSLRSSFEHVTFQLEYLADLVLQGMVDLIIKDSEKSLDDLL